VFNLNPMYHLVEAFRMPILTGSLPSLLHMTTTALMVIIVLIVGWGFTVYKADDLVYRI
jgi:ABC-type polysaccharide/polyol phosphate export permease